MLRLSGRLAVHHLRELSAIRCSSSMSNMHSTLFKTKCGSSFNLPNDLQPHMVEGKWKRPKISAMARKRLRKEALAAGGVFSFFSRFPRLLSFSCFIIHFRTSPCDFLLLLHAFIFSICHGILYFPYDFCFCCMWYISQYFSVVVRVGLILI